MEVINIHKAKTHLSSLVEKVAQGEPFIIAKAGKPIVKVVALDAPQTSETKRLGFLANELQVPDDFNEMGSREIEQLFSGKRS